MELPSNHDLPRNYRAERVYLICKLLVVIKLHLIDIPPSEAMGTKRVYLRWSVSLLRLVRSWISWNDWALRWLRLLPPCWS